MNNPTSNLKKGKGAPLHPALNSHLSKASLARNFRLKQHTLPIVVASVAVVLLVALGVFYQFPAAGQAIRNVYTAGDTWTDLVDNPSLQVDIGRVKHFEMEATVSSLGTRYFVIDITDHSLTNSKDKTITYQLSDSSGIVSLGRLGAQQADSGSILADDDQIPGFEIRYANGILDIRSLVLGDAPAAEISLYRGGDDPNTVPSLTPVFGERAGTSALPFFADISSSTGRTVSEVKAAYGTTNLTVTPDLHATRADFSLVPTRGPKKLVISVVLDASAVNPVKVNKTYLVSGDNIVYQLAAGTYPSTTVTLVDAAKGSVKVDYLFQPKTQRQPFSLPCLGQLSLTGNPVFNTTVDRTNPPGMNQNQRSRGASISTFNAQLQRVQGYFGQDRPSEFNTLYQLKGYQMRTNWDIPMAFSTTCTLPTNLVELPSLVPDWNLVAIAGVEPVSLEELNATKGLPGHKISELRELGLDDAFTPVQVLEPGKAYWVNVE